MTNENGESREQYANNLGLKTAQTVLYDPSCSCAKQMVPLIHTSIGNHLANSVDSPEKAGVGGSIPSLATI